MRATNKARISTDALVIKEKNIGESDKLLTLLTKDFGVIKAFSSGSKNIKNKKFSASSLLTYANFSLVKTNDVYKIYEADTIKSFFCAGQDISVLAISQYFCELAVFLAPCEMPSEEFLRLILNSLDQIVNKKRNIYLIKAITELRVSVISGYMPDIVACTECAEYEDEFFYFDVHIGKLFCKNCKRGNQFEKKINKTLLDAMRYIVFSDFEKLFKFEIPENSAKTLSDITEEFLKIHCEHKFMTLSFFKTVI